MDVKYTCPDHPDTKPPTPCAVCGRQAAQAIVEWLDIRKKSSPIGVTGINGLRIDGEPDFILSSETMDRLLSLFETTNKPAVLALAYIFDKCSSPVVEEMSRLLKVMSKEAKEPK